MAICKQENIAELGIQPGQIPFIAELLHYDQPITQDELSAALVIDKAATARALMALEENGFVTRIVNPQNRRQKLVRVTQKARAIQDDLLHIFQTAGDVITSDFSTEKKEYALEILNQMMTNAREHLNARQ